MLGNYCNSPPFFCSYGCCFPASGVGHWSGQQCAVQQLVFFAFVFVQVGSAHCHSTLLSTHISFLIFVCSLVVFVCCSWHSSDPAVFFVFLFCFPLFMTVRGLVSLAGYLTSSASSCLSPRVAGVRCWGFSGIALCDCLLCILVVVLVRVLKGEFMCENQFSVSTKHGSSSEGTIAALSILVPHALDLIYVHVVDDDDVFFSFFLLFIPSCPNSGVLFIQANN